MERKLQRSFRFMSFFDDGEMTDVYQRVTDLKPAVQSNWSNGSKNLSRVRIIKGGGGEQK